MTAMRRRTILTADRSMRRVDEHFGTAPPIACGATLREPAYYGLAYPTAQVRVLPQILVVNGMGKRGWTFTRETAVHLSSWGPFTRAKLVEGGLEVRVYVVGRQLSDALARDSWLAERA